MLKPYESVIAAETGHIAVHETGAIDACGHKINTVKAEDGKLSEENIQAVLNFHTDEHMVKPKAVFISNSTEIGSVYTRNELEKLSVFCRKNKLFLYLDGARLGSALASRMNDLTLADLAGLVDVFYIGGTKNGALLGEAVVILNDYIKENFRFYMKQKGALLAKGRILGIQFLELFKDELFFDLAGQANRMAFKLADGIKTLGFSFLTEPASNQIFPVLPDKIIAGLSRIYDFYVWCRVDENNSAIRLVTSWASDEEAAESFLEDLSSLKTKS
jgi:threonine aldolase